MTTIDFPTYVKNEKARTWIQEMVAMCRPDKFIGAMARRQSMTNCATSCPVGTFIKPERGKRPNSYLAAPTWRRGPRRRPDVHLQRQPERRRPTNNW